MAGAGGRDMQGCPFAPGSTASWSWWSGVIDGRSTRRKGRNPDRPFDEIEHDRGAKQADASDAIDAAALHAGNPSTWH